MQLFNFETSQIKGLIINFDALVKPLARLILIELLKILNFNNYML